METTVLICYATRKGVTAETAGWLSEGMKGADVTVRHVSEVDSLDYDLIVLGTPIRAGKIHPAMVDFLEKNKRGLADKPKIVFVVCLFVVLASRYLAKMKERLDGDIKTYRAFGGKMGFIDHRDKEYTLKAGKTFLQTVNQ